MHSPFYDNESQGLKNHWNVTVSLFIKQLCFCIIQNFSANISCEISSTLYQENTFQNSKICLFVFAWQTTRSFDKK